MTFIGNKKTIVQDIIDGLGSVPRKHIAGVTILPDEARALLKKLDPACRPMNHEVVEVLREHIDLDRWVHSPYPLVVSDRGLIVDGFHRLRACELSDKPIIMDVLVGFPDRNKKWLKPFHAPTSDPVLITVSGPVKVVQE